MWQQTTCGNPGEALRANDTAAARALCVAWVLDADPANRAKLHQEALQLEDYAKQRRAGDQIKLAFIQWCLVAQGLDAGVLKHSLVWWLGGWVGRQVSSRLQGMEQSWMARQPFAGQPLSSQHGVDTQTRRADEEGHVE